MKTNILINSIFIILVLLVKNGLADSCFNSASCLKIGETCGSDSSVCAVGLLCVDTKCAAIESCDPTLPIPQDTCSQSGQLCTKKNETGVCLTFISERFELNAPCKTSANCASSQCNDVSNFCNPNPPVAMCLTDYDCPITQYCSQPTMMMGTCSSKSGENGPCTSNNRCSSGLACVSSVCKPIFSGKENETCISDHTPSVTPCENGLYCISGTCTKYVEKPCNSSSSIENVCDSSYEVCECDSNGTEGTCKLKYRTTDQCKDAATKMSSCASAQGVSISLNSFKLQSQCGQQYCNYLKQCYNSRFFGCNKYELFRMCPSYDFVDIIDPPVDSSNSTSNSSSSSDSSNSNSSSSTSSSSSSSEDSVNSSNYSSPTSIIIFISILITITLYFY